MRKPCTQTPVSVPKCGRMLYGKHLMSRISGRCNIDSLQQKHLYLQQDRLKNPGTPLRTIRRLKKSWNKAGDWPKLLKAWKSHRYALGKYRYLFRLDHRKNYNHRPSLSMITVAYNMKIYVKNCLCRKHQHMSMSPGSLYKCSGRTPWHGRHEHVTS